MDNPYQVAQPLDRYSLQPTNDGGSYQSGPPFRPAKILTPVLRTLYVLMIPLLPALTLAVAYLESVGDSEPAFDDTTLVLAIAMMVLGLGVIMIFITTVIVHCMWTNRMNKNARALGAQGMEYTPGWAVGWFFVPVANLFKPYSVTSEIYRASRPGRDGTSWQREETPGIINFWWACWIIGNILDRIADRLLDLDKVGLIVGAIAACLTSASAAAAFVWVGRVHQRQLDNFAISERV